jgi:hypothetical protein
MNIYERKIEDILEINEKIQQTLKEKKIRFTFAYIGQLRCYKHDELI